MVLFVLFSPRVECTCLCGAWCLVCFIWLSFRQREESVKRTKMIRVTVLDTARSDSNSVPTLFLVGVQAVAALKLTFKEK